MSSEIVRTPNLLPAAGLGFARQKQFAFSLFIFLAVFQLPVFWVDRDSIGLYDAFLGLSLFFVFLNPYWRAIRITARWKHVLFAGFAYVTYLCFSLLIYFDTYSALLVIKNAEFLVEFLVCIAFLWDDDLNLERVRKVVVGIFFLLAIFQLANFGGVMRKAGVQSIVGGVPYRVGLPFMQEDSANPAGFVLGLYLIVASHFKRKTVLEIASMGLSLLAMVLTVSRTNLIGLVIVFAFFYLQAILSGRRSLLVFIIAISVLVAGVGIIYSSISQESVLWLNLFRYLSNPTGFLSDQSFTYRYIQHWPEAIDAWLTNPFTMLFGNGAGYLQIVDGTFPRLLANNGLVGVVLFVYFWFVTPALRHGKNAVISPILFFLIINSINAETLIVSYRSVQIFIVLYAFSVRYFGRPKRLSYE
jgi:hypothetical protein